MTNEIEQAKAAQRLIEELKLIRKANMGKSFTLQDDDGFLTGLINKALKLAFDPIVNKALKVMIDANPYKRTETEPFECELKPNELGGMLTDAHRKALGMMTSQD